MSADNRRRAYGIIARLIREGTDGMEDSILQRECLRVAEAMEAAAAVVDELVIDTNGKGSEFANGTEA